jgi:glyoxylase-like metal-dependent hydrolase (beta-lactamase superfamily II)
MVSYKQLISGLNIRPKIGFFGYSSVTLIKDGQENILFDVGGPGVREQIKHIKHTGKITKVFVSHLHLDHCANIDLFQDVPIFLNETELKWTLDSSDDSNLLVKLVVKNFLKNCEFRLFNDGFDLTDSVSVINTPGHTIASCSLKFRSENKNIIVAGDAIETLMEYRDTEINVGYFDVESYQQSKAFIKQNFDIIIPGHCSVIEKAKLKDQTIDLTYF